MYYPSNPWSPLGKRPVLKNNLQPPLEEMENFIKKPALDMTHTHLHQ